MAPSSSSPRSARASTGARGWPSSDSSRLVARRKARNRGERPLRLDRDRGTPLAKHEERKGDRQDEHRENRELEQEGVDGRGGGAFHAPELGRQDQHASSGGDQPYEKERLGRDDVLPEGHLNRIEELHDEEDEEDAVEEGDELLGKRAREKTRAEANGRGDEKEDRARSEQHAETDVNHVLDCRERRRDSSSGGIRPGPCCHGILQNVPRPE